MAYTENLSFVRREVNAPLSWVSLRSFSTFLEYEEFLWLRVNNPGGQNLNLENLQSDGVVVRDLAVLKAEPQ